MRLQLPHKVLMGAIRVSIAHAVRQHRDKALTSVAQTMGAITAPRATGGILSRGRTSIAQPSRTGGIGQHRQGRLGGDAGQKQVSLQVNGGAGLITALHSESVNINPNLCIDQITGRVEAAAQPVDLGCRNRFQQLCRQDRTRLRERSRYGDGCRCADWCGCGRDCG